MGKKGNGARVPKGTWGTGTGGILLIALGVVLLASAAVLMLRNRGVEREAGTAASRVAAPLIKVIEAAGEAPPPPAAQTYPGGRAEEIPRVRVCGEYYAGILEIPALGLVLPVYAGCTEEHLANAPCRYAGAAETKDLVIGGHNYSTHFGGLPQLSCGDTACFTDAYGQVFTYEVAVTETLEPWGVEEMTAGKYPLTLFTCTYGGANRVAVRFGEVE